VTVKPAAPTVTVEADIKLLIFSWDADPSATHYRLLENPDGHSGFTQVGADISAGSSSASLPIAVHLHDFTNALYMVEACNTVGCTVSSEVDAVNGALDAIGYLKASNAEGAPFDSCCPNYRANFADQFGSVVALSADGKTLAVGAGAEDSFATGINGDESDNTTLQSGAVYVFRFDGTAWAQQAYVKASNTERDDQFGYSIALSADGNTLVVGAPYEDSNATGVDGIQSDNTAFGAGAAYVFRFAGAGWHQQAYIKASNTYGRFEIPDPDDTEYVDGENFGSSVALSADGYTLAVGAPFESGSATVVDGDQNTYTRFYSGAAYVFHFDDTTWVQQAYFKASNADKDDQFGNSVALSSDGHTLAVGAWREDGEANGINGDQTDNSGNSAGAAYLYRFDDTSWRQQAYVKSSNSDPRDYFGAAVALSNDGNTLAVGARGESGGAIGINGDRHDNSKDGAGATYVFRFDNSYCSQQAYIKASNTDEGDDFGYAIALGRNGSMLTVSANRESSNAIGINGDENNDLYITGAVYVFGLDGSDWSQQAYVKAPNTDRGDRFGLSIAFSEDGETLAVGAPSEDSAATGINGDQTDNSAFGAGAAFVF